MSAKKGFLRFIFLLLCCCLISPLAQAPPTGAPAAGEHRATEKIVIVLAMHGEPPTDFPKDEFATFFALHARRAFAGAGGEDLNQRYADLDAKMRRWPRTAENDPFYAGSQEMAVHFRRATGYEVIVGFNQFCAPSVEEALEEAVAQKAGRIIVITPMMTPGGRHSTTEIPTAIKRAQQRHPDVPIEYAWPFDLSEVAEFLAHRIQQMNIETK